MSAAAFDVATLVNSPSFPNSIVWSEDNLIAIAAGDIVTILNPEQPRAPRGVITITAGKPFQIGVIDRSDLLSGCLLPTCLSRDRQPCVRSLSWSPVGFAPNNGCLLAVCSAEGLVKIYRQPYCEFQAEWIELMDISDMLHGYFAKINYREPEISSTLDDSATQTSRENVAAASKKDSAARKESKRKRDEDFETNLAHAVVETAVFPSNTLQEGSLVEVLEVDKEQHMWLSGKLQRLEGSKALVCFSEAGSNRDKQWFDMDSRIAMSNQTNHSSADGGFPRIRPSMNIACLPEQIACAEHNMISEVLKEGKLIEAWSTDRWLEGVYMGFSDGSLLAKFSEEAAVVALNPADVRLAPLWAAEDNSWRVTRVKVAVKEPSLEKESKSPQTDSAAKARANRSRKMLNNRSQCFITAQQYASRSSMLASVVVSWSPLLKMSNFSDFYSLLAVGSKSGDISLWRIHRPPHYSIEPQDDLKTMVLIGVLKAHNSWVTALSWGLLSSDSNPQVLLASGCSDGSVKIWQACGNNLETSSEANWIPFSLFNEVITGDNSVVSALSLLVPVQCPQKILLAVGKGSGSFEVWTCNTKPKSSKQIGSYDAHCQVVTGLAWAFDGRCLYSCSLDNSVHGWVYHKGSVSNVLIPPHTLGKSSSSDLPSVSDSCYGLAISPGNLALAVARRFDVEQLDKMYQMRTQRAGVEFFWIGGQQVDISSSFKLDLDIKDCLGLSKYELECWGSKLIWSLTQFECHDKHLVIWDIIAASLAFKKSDPSFVKHLFNTWLQLLFHPHLDSSTEDILSDTLTHLSKITSRRLHLLNIIIRRVLLSSGSKASKPSSKPANLEESCGTEEKRKWMKLLLNSEEELRERLVGISFCTVLSRSSHRASEEEFSSWNPIGIAQMTKWVTQDQGHVHSRLTSLASEVKQLSSRLQTSNHYKEEEQCSFCSSPIPFDSPEVAFCQGSNSTEEEASQKHKLVRCASSMEICPLTPVWYCICCERRASRLPPDQLFNMPRFPSNFLSYIKPMTKRLLPKPNCPFCGISLQRLQPDFFLSLSPV